MLANLTKRASINVFGAAAIAVLVGVAISVALLAVLTSSSRPGEMAAPAADEFPRAPVTAARGMAFIEANTFLPEIIQIIAPDAVPAATTHFLEINSFLPETSQTVASAFDLNRMLFIEWNAGFDQQAESVAPEIEPIRGPR